MTDSRLRLSVRLWQTALFVAVALVAEGLLWVLLTTGIAVSLREDAGAEQLRVAGEVASAASKAYPVTVETRNALLVEVERIAAVTGNDVWVFDAGGAEIVGVHSGDLVDEKLLERARRAGLTDSPRFKQVDISPDGAAVAARAIRDGGGQRVGSVVTAHSTSDALSVLDATKRSLRTTFLYAALVAGLVGLLFSDIIARRIAQLTKVARAIAGGDFAQRLPKSLMPDDVRELADVYNEMAERLGEAFATLREREREIAAVVESMAEALVALDSSGTVRVVNPAAESVLFMKADDMLHRPLAETVVNEDVVRLAREGLGGRPASETLELGRRILHMHVTPIASDGHAAGAVLLLSDVTEKTLTEEAQRRFIAHASHEMRTPISAMKGFLELLQGPARHDERIRDDFLKTMQAEVERLSRLVASLFTLAQADAGRLHVDMRPYSFAEIADDVLSVMRPVVDEAGIALRGELASGRLCVLADRDRVMQALIGLVDNAVKYAGTGGEIVLRARVNGEELVIEVQDRGPGIPPEAIPRLFDRFYRVEGGSARPGHGAGLGLAIVKEIVTAHGSEIEIDSTLGEGTRFRFRLPCTAACETRGELPA